MKGGIVDVDTMKIWKYISVLRCWIHHALDEPNADVCDALYAFKQSLSDPNNVLESWDPSLVDPCTWFHITCDSDNHVTRLDLYNYNLAGTLSPELGQLPYLQYLYVSDPSLDFRELNENRISGKIPQELGNLKNLVSMDLSNNQLEGHIPATFGNLMSLKFLWLNDNKLIGRVPRNVTHLNLQVFDISNNPLAKPPPHMATLGIPQ
ncbi:unnamed protein product [Sphenostylis stenocarpa]|uniref:Leucine-rich repeat-containing N-terminal plant-type domain-containing protein n=1 Tax=Sphenostylis stenocarpa TaxID=92480 RepID=A0AA86RVJ3_9FABA|nr:unnamed protein product [Sphenostylis stenocarpa]